MKIADVAKMSPLDRFLYWVKERHNIFLRRRAGKPRPWTDDEVMQSVFFTNPYRENDKTTVWFRENVREPLRNDPKVLFAVIAFRWFNLSATGELLMTSPNLLLNWDEQDAINRLKEANRLGPVFTGAFMIKVGNGPPGCKIPQVCQAISNVWQVRDHTLSQWRPDCTMEEAHKSLMKFRGLGGFMAYEIVCDLRYTYLLEDATDIDTWCNLGPGAARGLLRMTGQPLTIAKSGRMRDTIPKPPKDWITRLQGILTTLKQRLPKMPKFELREVEHSLCEWDKYERALSGIGRLKRLYQGGHNA